jgi:hypothetical protein
VYWSPDFRTEEQIQIDSDNSYFYTVLHNETLALEQAIKSKNRIVQLIKNLSIIKKRSKTNEIFLDNIFKAAIKCNLVSQVRTYCIFEKLPFEYEKAALQTNILPEIIITALNELEVELQSNDIASIEQLSKEIYKNENREIEYDRVGKVQKFIHEIIENKHGIDKLLKTDKEKMRRILSLCRIHLTVQDVKDQTIAEFCDNLEKITERRKSKSKIPVNYLAKFNKKYIYNWNQRHLKTITFYSSNNSLNLFQKLLEIDPCNSSLNEIVETTIKYWHLDPDKLMK